MVVIAIDGPAASGKGTLGRRLAEHFGLPHLDTGLLYRATALTLIERGDPLSDPDKAAAAARTLSFSPADEDRLRGAAMGEAASVVAAIPAVRAALLAMQRAFAAQPGGAVLDGRDIGTAICPDAEVKIFVTASPEERARRRMLELQSRGEAAEFSDILADIRKRDERDAGRSTAPLTQAADAWLLDTTGLGKDEVFDRARDHVESIAAGAGRAASLAPGG